VAGGSPRFETLGLRDVQVSHRLKSRSPARNRWQREARFAGSAAYDAGYDECAEIGFILV
jgi:hypothetical protein